MNGFIASIDNQTINNQNFRKVVYTAPHSQLVVMTLQPGEEIGKEVHQDIDQYIVIKDGVARVDLGGEINTVGPDFIVVVPAGIEHNIVNDSADSVLRLYTIYTPPEHAYDTIHRTKEEADAAEHHH